MTSVAENFFVYGTLKRGQHRQDQWPRKPLSVRRAWTLGKLYDIGPYPALRPGEDRVAGQVWTIAAEDVAETIRVLDWIEGTNQPKYPNEYDRVKIEVQYLDGSHASASAYIFANMEMLELAEYLPPSIEVDGSHYSIWPDESPWLPG